tara:strand:+ start:125 stop:253 length:129 start_codon:yes stop_codon:yes gene_type:complete
MLRDATFAIYQNKPRRKTAKIQAQDKSYRELLQEESQEYMYI